MRGRRQRRGGLYPDRETALLQTAVPNSEPLLAAPAQPRSDTGHWSSHTITAKVVLKSCLGKEKTTKTDQHRLDFSPTRISSLTHVRLGKTLYLQDITVTSLYEEGSQRTSTKASRHHSKTHEVARCARELLPRGLEGQRFSCVYQTSQNIC